MLTTSRIASADFKTRRDVMAYSVAKGHNGLRQLDRGEGTSNDVYRVPGLQGSGDFLNLVSFQNVVLLYVIKAGQFNAALHPALHFAHIIFLAPQGIDRIVANR